MSNVVPVSELVRRRTYQYKRANFIAFFAKTGFINKTTEFTIAKLGNCKVYYPLTNIIPSAHANTAGIIEEEYKWLQDNLSK